jgi:sugar lactone lactonase YvrE
MGGDIHQYTPGTGTFATYSLGKKIGSIALAGKKFIAAMENGFSFVDLEKETVEPVVDPEEHINGNRFNDGKCDPAGRFWAGTMALTEETGAGNLYVLHPDLSFEKKIGNVSISNGIAWSRDEKIMYYIDSPTRQVVCYDYNKNSGQICNPNAIITLDVSEGYPDGMTIDNEGMLWIAHWGGWKITRWDPMAGKKLMQIVMPVSQVTSCTFGGEDFHDLYITSANKGLSQKQLQREPLAGSLFVIKNCGYKGLPACEFRQFL